MPVRAHLRISMLVVVLAASFDCRASAVEYTRAHTLPPVKLTYDDVDRILSRYWGLLATANAAYTNATVASETLTLSTGDQDFAFGGHAISDRTNLPTTVYKLEYEAFFEHGAISRIDIELEDYRRTISVSGVSADQVDVIESALERDLSTYAAFPGGMVFRSFCVSLIGLCCYFVLIFFAVLIFGKESIFQKPLLVSCIVTAFAVQVLTYLLPTEKWFPGFAAFKNEASWIVRDGPQISFFGVVVTIIGIPLSLLLSRWFGQANKPTIAPPPNTEEEKPFVD